MRLDVFEDAIGLQKTVLIPYETGHALGLAWGIAHAFKKPS